MAQTRDQTNDLRRWLIRHLEPGEPLHVTLIRAHTNDVYRVETGDRRLVLKVYGAGWRRDTEIRYEIDLLRHLAAQNIAVASPIPGSDGDALHHINLAGATRQAVLFAYADGEKPSPPFTTEMYRRQGMATAALHRAADTFTSAHHRSPLDLACLIDRPLQLITSLDIDDVARDTLAAIGAFLRERITELAHRGLDWGACHGDLTFDNVHITASGETVWYDFDSGGPGWRAIDLQGWALASPERQADWRAFLDGYRSVRPLGDHDIATAPYMWLARVFWGIGVDLERRVLGEGEERMRAWLTARCAALTEAIRTIEQRSPPRHWSRRPTA